MPDEQDIGGECEIRRTAGGGLVIRTHNSERAVSDDDIARWDTPGYVWSCKAGRMVRAPTDEKVFVKMLERFNIEYDKEVVKDRVYYTIWGGYGGFYSQWGFDLDGAFKEVGSYE